MEEQPLYRLQVLIENKYGKNKLQLAYEIVAKWVSFQVMDGVWISHSVFMRCRQTVAKECDLTGYDAYRLCQLFGLKSPRELFTFPEQAPQYLLNQFKTLKEFYENKDTNAKGVRDASLLPG